MASTYKATLHGDRLEWRGGAPDVPPDRDVDVIVKVVGSFRPSGEDEAGRGARAAAALERIAAAGGPGIEDPLAWEREMREERPLPGREEVDADDGQPRPEGPAA
jgi:hypothetical protein